VTPAIAYCLYAESARHTGTDWSRNYVTYPKAGDVRRLMPEECEGVMAFPPDWTVPERIDWDEETYDSLRYHALGNAVTPPVAEWLAERIASYLAAEVAYASECGSLSELQVAEASTS
jgi:DNA (cytosine-5)-methyltransferase 1